MSQQESVLSDVSLVDPGIGFEYNNYVYTILCLEYTLDMMISQDSMIVCAKQQIQLPTPKITVIRSYADEADAISYVTIMNDNALDVATSARNSIVNLLGTNNIVMKLNPSTYDYVAIVRKHEYVKNELHGSVLEKEMKCH